MKIDMHVHLEEGPYSNRFFKKTIKSIYEIESKKDKRSIYDMTEKSELFLRRMQEGDYSEWWMDYYLKAAIKKDIKVVGIIDHLYRFYEAEVYYKNHMDISKSKDGKIQERWLKQVMWHYMDDFIHLVESQKEKWASYGIELRVGIEVDYFDDADEMLRNILEPYEFDYVVGAVHFNNGLMISNPKLLPTFEKFKIEHIYDAHYQTTERAIESGLFDIMAHIDHIKILGKVDELHLLYMYEEIAKALKTHDVVCELNAGMRYHTKLKEVSPSKKFVQTIAKRGVSFTTSSDGHFPNDLGKYNKNLRRILHDVGVEEIVGFKKRKREYFRLNAEETANKSS
ncbi:PHP domain-containing protein [Phocicoccus pinnipedialis]|uniref:Histidinol-phosphatase n=1 Tax=Phocicoccus pinnipedialis TaxID=110845 RepID=A0A6V7RB07_9BACL|nr:PHP domain-containing protein [Jeotgalicoccus pinnipedialis]MBP1939890.1 histidinol-phosphatase (PHP family) [Jeotgalicoccus pinnipedialis]CAD2074740.1 hypothetical protein JEOPIN946_00824 [Jeotgalicoccus pinnipedialis]